MVRAVEAGDIQSMSAKAVPKKDVKELKKESGLKPLSFFVLYYLP